MALTKDTLAILADLDPTISDAYEASYSDALSSADRWLETLSTVEMTDTEKVNLPFLFDTLATTIGKPGDSPIYQTMVGSNQIIELRKIMNAAQASQLNIENPFMRSQILNQVQGMGIKMAYESQFLAVNALNVGDTDSYYTVYDGEQLFSTSHLVGEAGTTWGNLTTVALAAASFNTVKTNFRKIPWGANGRFLKMSGATFYLIVPPALEITARDLLFNSNFPEATFNKDNMFKGAAQLIVDEDLTSATDWFMAVTLPGAKPFIHLKHATLSGQGIIAQTSPDDPAVRDYDNYRWSVKSFEEVFPGQFWLLSKANVA